MLWKGSFQRVGNVFWLLFFKVRSSREIKVRVRNSILEGSFPVPDRVAFGKNLIFFMLCSGAFSTPHLWIRSAVCPIRLVLRPYAGGCVRPNPVQFQSRQSRQPAWNSTAKSARETKTAFRRETASCTLPMGQMH